MILKFDLQKDGASQAIVTVAVDDKGKIEDLSCTDPQLTMGLLNQNGSNSFASLVQCTFSGQICSDQIDVLYGRRWRSYKAQQMA